MWYTRGGGKIIVCEIGQNWCADPQLGKDLIYLAWHSGADLAKFQLYDSKELYGEYQDTELSFDLAREFFEYGREIGIEVFFSVFDIERVRWCEDIGVKRIKIAYSQRNNLDLIARAGQKSELIVSTDYPYIGRYALYCVPHYPARIEEIDFEDLADFDGLSDHTIGLDAAKIALARGAEIIEKHFAIDHKIGVDAPWSMTPSECRELKRWELVCKRIM